MCVCVCIPPHEKDATQGRFFSGVSQVSIRSFPSPRFVVIPILNSLVYLIILSIAGGRIIGFIPFPGELTLFEMQTVPSRV